MTATLQPPDISVSGQVPLDHHSPTFPVSLVHPGRQTLPAATPDQIENLLCGHVEMREAREVARFLVRLLDSTAGGDFYPTDDDGDIRTGGLVALAGSAGTSVDGIELATDARDADDVCWRIPGGGMDAGSAARVLTRFARRRYGVSSCPSCGEFFVLGNGDYCDACWELICSDCQCLCDGCDCDSGRCDDCGCRPPSRVRDYSFRPRPRFLRTNGDDESLFFGWELEVAAEDGISNAIYTGVGKQESVLYCKHDGSIDGVEIVSHPMTYRYLREVFPLGMFDDLAEYVNDTGPCDGYGLHVHVSRSGFKSQAHVLRWLLFLYRNVSGVTRVAGRSSAQWARFSAQHNPGELALKAKGETGFARYEAVNVQNANTFEVRIFQSEWSRERLLSAVGMVHASVKYTEGLRSADILTGHKLEWPAFTVWASARPEYAELTSLL